MLRKRRGSERASERGKQRQLKHRRFNSIIITGRRPQWDLEASAHAYVNVYAQVGPSWTGFTRRTLRRGKTQAQFLLSDAETDKRPSGF